MGILEFFGLGNNAPAPTPEPDTRGTGRHSEPGVDETTPDNEVVEDESTDHDNTEPANDSVEPEAVEEDEAETVHPAPEAVEPSEVHSALHTALIKLDGRLSDPAALPYDEAHLTDHEALSVAIGDLIERAPHLSATAVAGDVGQGDRGGNPAPFDLIATMRQAHGIT